MTIFSYLSYQCTISYQSPHSRLKEHPAVTEPRSIVEGSVSAAIPVSNRCRTCPYNAGTILGAIKEQNLIKC